MAETTTKKKSSKGVSVEDKLIALYTLQKIDSKIDEIRILRGELPLEVQDLEDEITGLETRVAHINEEIEQVEQTVVEKKNLIVDSEALIKKYTEQQNNVRNNREFDSLSKEIEFQTLEIQLAEKRIKEAGANIEAKNEILAESQVRLDEKKEDLVHKKEELAGIVSDTQKEEEKLMKDSAKASEIIEERLTNAYNRIRTNARNGLSVVRVERNSCGGCFNQIPPQRHLDISTHKKIIVCEHCGRILVDDIIHTKVVGEEVTK